MLVLQEHAHLGHHGVWIVAQDDIGSLSEPFSEVGENISRMATYCWVSKENVSWHRDDNWKFVRALLKLERTYN